MVGGTITLTSLAKTRILSFETRIRFSEKTQKRERKLSFSPV